MPELITGQDIGIHAFLSMEEESPLGICVFHDSGATFLTLEELMEESLIDLNSQMRQRYAAASIFSRHTW